LFIKKNVGILVNNPFQVIFLPNKLIIEEVPLLSYRVFAVTVVVASIEGAAVHNDPIEVVDELLRRMGLDVVVFDELCDV
jgi:hypothetical protein